MRTPLNGVIAALDILRQTTRLSARQARFLGIAESSGQVALEQINDVLELARLDGGGTPEALSAFHLGEALRDLAEQAEPLAARQRNRIALDLAPDTDRWINGPRRALLRVLLNLLGNAAKFTTGGTITLSARLVETGMAGLRLDLAVADTGIGIAADKLDVIFTPFEQLDNGYDRLTEGNGLGLGIALRTVEVQGGKLWVESASGQGSTFHVSLPVAPGTAGAEETVAEPGLLRDKSPLPVHDILIVEDNPTNRLVLREMLRHLGQRVTEAPNGAVAIRLAATAAYDLIFMDISMPEIDGLAATAAIRAGGASAGARIVGLTAHDLPEDPERFRAGGMAEVLQKPITFATLVPRLAPSRPATAEDIAGSGFDAPVMAELVGLLSEGQRRALLADFLTEGGAFLRALETGVAVPDLTVLAHRLKGAAAVLGVSGLVEQLAVLEADLLAGRAPAPARCHETAERWRQLAGELPKRLLPDLALGQG